MKKNRLAVNLVFDLILLLLIAMISLSGFIMNYVLPCGHAIRNKGAKALAENVFGLGRHDWGDIHWMLSVLLLVVLIIHVALHWNIITAFISRNIPNQLTRTLFYILLVVIGLSVCIPWIIVFLF